MPWLAAGINSMSEQSMKEQVIGLEATVLQHEKELYGDGSNLGISQKVTVLWRIHTWLLCTLSALFGSAATLVVERLLGHTP
jgi:hypothetical protein